MIATGTDVKLLECLLFMRNVRSKNYFDQMKGRGTRTLDQDALKKRQFDEFFRFVKRGFPNSPSERTASVELTLRSTFSTVGYRLDTPQKQGLVRSISLTTA